MKRDAFQKNMKYFFEACNVFFSDFIQWFFRTLNRKTRQKVTLRKIREETAEHVSHLGLTLKRVILPLSLCYLFIGFLLGRNVMDSLFLGLLIFIYSNFLPDVLSPFRNRKKQTTNETAFKKYTLLFFAPIFIFLLMKDGTPTLRTAETFHNLKSLGVYSIFMLLLGFAFYGNLPFSIGRVIEIMSPTIFGSLGYLTHLKVDRIL